MERRHRYRPGLLRRAAAGAWHVPAGFAYVLRHPRLWPLALFPAVLAIACVVGGAGLGWYAIPYVENALVPGPGKAAEEYGFLITFTVWVGLLVAGMVTGLAAALLLSAPILELLSRRVEAMLQGRVIERGGGLRWEIAQSFRGALYFLLATPGVVLLSLIPLVGPPMGALWGAYALSFQQTDVPLARRGLDFAARRAWHRRWRAESIGFGLAGLFTLLIPFANLLVTPALAVGGTLLVLGLKEGMDLSEKPEGEAPPETAGET